MFGRLFLLFTLLPAIELYGLVRAGQWLGAGPTVAIVVATGAVGAWLARREGQRTLARLSQGLAQGIPPGQDLMDGLLVVVGGVLLLTPGFLTDVMGLACLLPPSRRLLARNLVGAAERRARAGTLRVRWGGARWGRGGPTPGSTGTDRPPATAVDAPFGGTWDAQEGVIRAPPQDGPRRP